MIWIHIGSFLSLNLGNASDAIIRTKPKQRSRQWKLATSKGLQWTGAWVIVGDSRITVCVCPCPSLHLAFCKRVNKEEEEEEEDQCNDEIPHNKLSCEVNMTYNGGVAYQKRWLSTAKAVAQSHGTDSILRFDSTERSRTMNPHLNPRVFYISSKKQEKPNRLARINEIGSQINTPNPGSSKHRRLGLLIGYSSNEIKKGE